MLLGGRNGSGEGLARRCSTAAHRASAHGTGVLDLEGGVHDLDVPSGKEDASAGRGPGAVARFVCFPSFFFLSFFFLFLRKAS